jgi:hypothetical protein
LWVPFPRNLKQHRKYPCEDACLVSRPVQQSFVRREIEPPIFARLGGIARVVHNPSHVCQQSDDSTSRKERNIELLNDVASRSIFFW